MKYIYLFNNVVTECLSVNPYSVVSKSYAEKFIEAPEHVKVGFVFDGTVFIDPTVMPKSPEEIKQEITDATSKRLDDFAKTRNYDSIISACTYATSTIPQFANEGQLCVNLRDATWGKLYQIMQEVEAGTRPMPTGYADVEAELPILDWANSV